VHFAQYGAEIIETLALAPHPEGGYYRETWRDATTAGKRGRGTAIYYLLASRWRRPAGRLAVNSRTS